MKKIVDVSVLATNYNNAKFLDDFFESIVNSTVAPAEVVFVDDGSTDNSIEIAEKYNKILPLKIVSFEKNKGRAAALNKGKNLCNSKYTLIIDPDDIMLPDRIEKQYNFMEQNPQIDVLGGNVTYFNSITGKILNKSNFPQKKIYETYAKGENGVLQPTVIIKTDVIKKYQYKQIVPGQDYELFSRIVVDGYKFSNLTDILNKMRVHPQSAVSNLKYSSIKQIFEQRDLIFGTKTSDLKVYFYFIHLLNYRKSMLSNKKLAKIYYKIIASLFYPSKIFKRL